MRHGSGEDTKSPKALHVVAVVGILALAILVSAPARVLAIDVDTGLYAAPHFFGNNGELGKTEGARGRSFDHTVGPGLRAGFWLYNNLGVEVEGGAMLASARHADVSVVLATIRAHGVLRARWRKLELLALTGAGGMRAMRQGDSWPARDGWNALK